MKVLSSHYRKAIDACQVHFELSWGSEVCRLLMASESFVMLFFWQHLLVDSICWDVWNAEKIIQVATWVELTCFGKHGEEMGSPVTVMGEDGSDLP